MYLVKHKSLDVLRVAKVVQKSSADYERILREANLIKHFKNTGIPLIYDIEEDSDSICIIEEYISGKSLADYVQESQPLSVEDIVCLGVRICEVLEYLHEHVGILHLDIKPENIIIRDVSSDTASDVLTDTAEKFCVSIIDFDNAVRLGEGAGVCYGTLGFAAPEQYMLPEAHQSFCEKAQQREGQMPGPQTDIFSMGMLLLYMANGGHMQSILTDKVHLCSLYSDNIGPIIERCIRHQKYQRFQSITMLKNELLQLKNMPLPQCADIKTDDAYDIYVYGTKRGIGVTHFCLCLAACLARQKKRVVCIRHGDTYDWTADEFRHRLTGKGLYQVRDIYLAPEYNAGIDCDISDFDIRIHDCGVCGKSRAYDARQKACGKDIRILLGDAGYRRSDTLCMEQEDRNTIIFINHISGKDFYYYTSTHATGHLYFRFPCMYTWYEQNELFEEAAHTALEKILLPLGRQNRLKPMVQRILKTQVKAVKKGVISAVAKRYAKGKSQ